MNPYQPGDLRHTFVALLDSIEHAGKVQYELEQAAHWSRAARPNCGNCNLWMTDACPLERHVNGRRRGPSMNGAACSLFSEKAGVQEWREKAATHRRNAEVIASERPTP